MTADTRLAGAMLVFPRGRTVERLALDVLLRRAVLN